MIPTSLRIPFSFRVARSWARLVAAFATIAVIVCLIYGRSLDAPFIFDDFDSIVENPSITRLWPLIGDSASPGPLNGARAHTPTAGRPLVNLTLAVNFRISRLQPTSYRAFNIAAHILSALLLFLILRRTLRLPALSGRFDRDADAVALIVALLWATHPLQTEAVVYVTQRTELLMALFYLMTLYCAVRYWASESRGARAFWIAVATAASMAGMASKEVMVSVPVVILFFERTLVANSFREALKRSTPLYLALASGWLLLAYLNVGSPRGEAAGFGRGVSAVTWWLTQAKVFFIYLKLVLWPHRLATHYDLQLARTLAEVWAPVLMFVMLAGLTVMMLYRRKPAGMAGLWVFAILSPTLLVPINTEIVAERRMYLPLAAVLVLVVTGVHAVWSRRSAGIAASAMLLICCAWSARRLRVYDDELLLWEDTVASQPNGALARYNLGVLLASRDRIAEALPQFERAVALDPRYASAHFNLATALDALGRSREAIPHFEAAFRLDGGSASDHVAFAAVLTRAGRLHDAISQLQRAAQLDSTDLSILGKLADAHAQAGESAQAIDAAERGVRLARSKGQLDLADRGEAWVSSYRKTLRSGH